MPRPKLILALLLIATGGAASADKWQRFTSPRGFSVMYPTAWFRIGTSTDRLEILSSKGGAKGIIIKRGQALITVVEPEGSATKALRDVIDQYTKDTTVVSLTDIRPDTAGQACKNLKEVISKEPPIPRDDMAIRTPDIVNTDFFCEAENDKILVLLRNWEGDQKQEEYQRTALKIAQSISVQP